MKKIGLEAILDMANFNKGMGQYNAGVDGMNKKTTSLGTILGGAGKAIAGIGVAAAAAAVGGIAAATKMLASTIEPASDLSESMSKARVVFADSSQEMITWSQSAATAMGMSQQQALEAAGTYGNLFSALGLSGDASVDMSQNIVQLAADLGSFNNIPVADALEKLRAGLTGEAEPLKALGVNLNEVTIKAKALDMGLVKSAVNMTKVRLATSTLAKKREAAAAALAKYGEGSREYQDALLQAEAQEQKLGDLMQGKVGDLTAAQKAQAAYALIMEQTSLAQGDFERTSEGLANQQKILKARMTDVKATIGTALLPSLEQVTRAITTKLASPEAQAAIDKLAGWLKTNLPQAITTAKNFLDTKLVPAFKAVGEWIQTNVVPALKEAYNWLQTNLPIAIATAQRWFLYTFKPALYEVWEWTNAHIIPLLQSIWTLLSETIPNAISKLDWSKLKVDPSTSQTINELEAWLRAIKDIIDAINEGKPIDWKRILGNPTLTGKPDQWYTPESPVGKAADWFKAVLHILDNFFQGKHWTDPGTAPGGSQNSVPVTPPANVPPMNLPMFSGGGSVQSMPAMTQARLGGGGGTTNNSVGGDTFIQNITDPVSMAMAMALVQDRKRDRWNAAMGVT